MGGFFFLKVACLKMSKRLKSLINALFNLIQV
jgi:hypothetical protein